PLGVKDNSRLDNLCRWINDTAYHARWIDVLTDRTSRIDALKASSVPFAAMPIEVPPRKSILRGNDRSVWTKDGLQASRNRGDAVRLERYDEEVDFADSFRIVRGLRVDLKVPNLAAYAHAVLLHCAQMRAACDERHVFTRACQHCAEECADGTCADNRESHG